MESNIIGQNKILSIVDSFNLDNCPRTLLIEGFKGSGKHLIAQYITKHLNIELIDLTKNLTLDSITEAMLCATPRGYLIDTSNISIKNQNTILKFLEEPTRNCFIILLSENTHLLLDTVVNRCYILELSKYSKQDLQQFAVNEEILEYAETPGDVIELSGENFDEYKRLSSLIITSISKASISNTLTLTDKFDSKNGELNLNLFLKVLIKYIMNTIKETNDIKYYQLYNLTNKFIKDLKINSNQNRLMDKYLIDMKSIMR